MRTQEMLRVHPGKTLLDKEIVESSIQELIEAQQACTVCADSCLSEEEVKMLTRCIQLNLDCADVINTTVRLLSRPATPSLELVKQQLMASITALEACATECQKHSKMEHCKICMEICRSTKESTQRMLSSIKK